MKDICWLDCEREGTIYEHRTFLGTYEICLCPEHAAEFRQLKANGPYTGAFPTPRNSRATSWPFMEKQRINN